MNINETALWLKQRDNYLVISHRRPDGDAHGSAAALVQGLRSCGKTAYIFKNAETTARYEKFVAPFWAPDNYVPEHIITVDTASEALFPRGAKEYLGKTDLAIDHHPSNTLYAAESCIDGSRAACGEIIYDLLIALNGSIDQISAAALYIAVSTDTGCFAFGNTTANTFRVASLLADTGIAFQELNRLLFRTKSRGRFELESMVMSEIGFYYGGRVAITTIPRSVMDRTGCTEDDMDDIAAIPGSVEGVLCGITIRELSSETDCKISVRSGREFNSNELCRVFGGGGHAMAAGASIKATIGEIKQMLLDELDKTFLTEGCTR